MKMTISKLLQLVVLPAAGLGTLAAVTLSYLAPAVRALTVRPPRPLRRLWLRVCYHASLAVPALLAVLMLYLLLLCFA